MNNPNPMTGKELVVAKLTDQREKHGFTDQRDDEQVDGSLYRAAMSLLSEHYGDGNEPISWPWRNADEPPSRSFNRFIEMPAVERKVHGLALLSAEYGRIGRLLKRHMATLDQLLDPLEVGQSFTIAGDKDRVWTKIGMRGDLHVLVFDPGEGDVNIELRQRTDLERITSK